MSQVVMLVLVLVLVVQAADMYTALGVHASKPTGSNTCQNRFHGNDEIAGAPLS